MDANWILHLLAGFSSTILLVRSLRRRVWGFALAALPAVVASGLGFFFWRDHAGYIAGALWGGLVIAPILGQRVVGRLLRQQRFGAAARFDTVLRFLHPLDGWWERARLYRALDLGQRGRIDDSTALLEQLMRSSPAHRSEAQMHLFRLRGSWEEVVAWLEDPAVADLTVLPMHLRALGEIGALERLVTLYADRALALDRPGYVAVKNLCHLFVFAFAGRAERVAALLDGPLADYPEPLRIFWRRTAELTTAPHGPARAALVGLLAQADATLRLAVHRRLDYPLADPRQTLSPRAIAVLDRLAQEQDHEARYGPAVAGFRPYATFGVMVPILMMFVAQVLVGRHFAPEDGFLDWSESGAALRILGAMLPSAVIAGEWWRLGAGTLLHYGPLHLVMNLMGLYVLGPYVEFALGRVRYVIVYVVAGVGMMSIVVLLCWAGWMEDNPLVGASGAIMGMVGATGAVALRGFRVARSRVALRRLRSMALIVAWQAGFDYLTPQVSSISHVGGAVLGFVVASGMAHRVTQGEPG